jgi:hypothetical protein
VNKDWKKLEAAAAAQGFTAKETKKGRFWLSPDGNHMVLVHTTPGDRRALANTIANFRRAGLTWPPPGKTGTRQ